MYLKESTYFTKRRYIGWRKVEETGAIYKISVYPRMIVDEIVGMNDVNKCLAMYIHTQMKS
jgi:hypothetical protein